MSFYNFARSAAGFFVRLIYKYEFIGLENVPQDRGFILASNHISNFDPVSVAIELKPIVSYMAKRELFKFPIGIIISHLYTIPVDRGSGDRSALVKSQEVVQNGGVLGIFPEGHRSKDGKLHRGKSGVVIIAARTNCDVLPVGVKKVKQKGPRRTKMIVKYGTPIKSEELHVGENMDKAELKAASNLLMGRIAELVGVEYP